ncbi:MAG: autotransporter domain-containing protein [Sulfurimonas sp.]|uniref:autotransporter domain-containing protein n=1 Tax=Sulfurimonas sp. TaxID=2022749 RepID=UPI002619A21A|nr:autotransporter domain-containing protein [Sulfurimonas sp.]MDD2651482.1 autotransporter domain-containing protein [Sulfurimonas sp.]MDD3451023.1 autotransporter domain-containing protein [Sulfurimonas sp.]
MQKELKISLIALALLLSSSALYGASMVALGDLAGGDLYGIARAVNADGSVVVGLSSSANGYEAFRWTQEGGMVGLGDLTGGSFYSDANSVSADGGVVVGISISANGYEAFRWTQGGGMVGLGDLAGGFFFSTAMGVSADGSVVVGESNSANGYEAFRWTQAGGMVGLGDLAGGSFDSIAIGVSADGSVVVGRSNSANGDEAFRWTQAGGMVGLGDLAGGVFDSIAMGVNADGSVVVGIGNSANGDEAFRWTQAGGMVGLGDLAGGGFYSKAFAVNADGSVIVGQSNSASGNEAFRWTQTKGMQTLGEWLLESGYTLSGWSDTKATGVSADGNVVVGQGASTNAHEAFIAKAGQGMIGLSDFGASLESINGIIPQTVTSVSTLLHGAHGHPANRRALDDKRVMWVAGDISHDNRHNTKDDGYVGEIGISIKESERFTYSIAFGKLFGESKLDYKGEVDSDGEYIVADTDIKPFKDIPLYATTTLAYGKNDLSIKRGYDNAGTLTYSSGDTKQSFLAFKQRLQYQLDTFFPYVEFDHIKITQDAYSESGGGFPAIYDKSKENISDWRVGVDANFKLNDSNVLITTLEGVHRIQERGNGVSGQIVGLSSFDIEGRKYDQNWLRATVGLEHTFENSSKFTLTLNRTTEGEDPTFWSGFNYSLPF